MRWVGRLLAEIMLGINILIVLMLLLAAYSSYLNPQSFPTLSCMGLAFPVFLLANLLFFCFWLFVHRKYALLSFLALIGCWGAITTYVPLNWFKGDAPDNAVRILSYNTRAFGEKASHTKETPNEILAYLQQSDADIICLQEYIWGNKLKKKDIDYAMRKYPYKHYYSLAGGLNGLGCYSRFPILSTKPIPYKSNRNGSIVYYIKVKEDTLVVINNHLESNRIFKADVETYQDMVDAPNSQNLSSGMRKLLKKLAEATVRRSTQVDKVRETIQSLKGKKLIACGDFNDTPISYTHRAMCEDLQDAFVEAGNGLGISYNRNRLYFRIDHILASKDLKIFDCKVDDSIKASDHNPIWCFVSLK